MSTASPFNNENETTSDNDGNSEYDDDDETMLNYEFVMDDLSDGDENLQIDEEDNTDDEGAMEHGDGEMIISDFIPPTPSQEVKTEPTDTAGVEGFFIKQEPEDDTEYNDITSKSLTNTLPHHI